MHITPIRSLCNAFHNEMFVDVPLTPDYRPVYCLRFNNCRIMGLHFAYPTTLLLTNSMLIAPYDDASSKQAYAQNKYTQAAFCLNDLKTFEVETIRTPVFFFMYDFTNDANFMYDAVPLLVVYNALKRDLAGADLKLLVPDAMYMSASTMSLLRLLLDDPDRDTNIIIHNNPHNVYSTVYVSTSLTRGDDSLQPPHHALYEFYAESTPKILERAGDGAPRYSPNFRLVSQELDRECPNILDKVNMFYFAEKITICDSADSDPFKILPYVLFCKASCILEIPKSFNCEMFRYFYSHLLDIRYYT